MKNKNSIYELLFLIIIILFISGCSSKPTIETETKTIINIDRILYNGNNTYTIFRYENGNYKISKIYADLYKCNNNESEPYIIMTTRIEKSKWLWVDEIRHYHEYTIYIPDVGYIYPGVEIRHFGKITKRIKLHDIY